MKYMLIYNELQDAFQTRDNPEVAGEYWGAWRQYMDNMGQAGIIESGAALLGPHTASLVRMSGGKRTVHDGPFADSKEQLGGFVIIEVPDLDTALDWAEQAPCAKAGSVEVRPVMPMNSGD
ncbi:MAG: YciI family protein [Myxococcota bacterium]